DVERSWLATAVAAGRALATAPAPGLRAAIARALAALHAAPSPGLPVRDPREDLGAAARALAALSEVAPELAERARSVGAGLRAALGPLQPASPVFTLGDLGAEPPPRGGHAPAVLHWGQGA